MMLAILYPVFAHPHVTDKLTVLMSIVCMVGVLRHKQQSRQNA